MPISGWMLAMLLVSAACVERNPAFMPGADTGRPVATNGSAGIGDGSLGGTAPTSGGSAGVGASGGGTMGMTATGGPSTCPAGTVCFSDPTTLLVGYDAHDVATADADGDGASDFVLVYHGGAVLAFGDGQGHIDQFQQFILVPDTSITRVVWEDLDGDEDLDLVYAGSTLPFFGIHTNIAARSFEGPGVVTAVENPTGVAAGDFNGDGVVDLAAAFADSGLARAFLGDGKGGYPEPLAIELSAAQEILAGDFDDDGVDELAVTPVSGSADAPGVHLINFDDIGQSTVRTYLPSLLPTALTGGDFNGDGIEDLAVASEGSRVDFIWGQRGRELELGPVILTDLTPLDLASCDLDGDGVLDLATIESGGIATVALGTPSGGFVLSYHQVSDTASAVACADMDGNGRDDLVVGISGVLLGGIEVYASQ